MFSCEFCEIFKDTFFLKNTYGGWFFSIIYILLCIDIYNEIKCNDKRAS